MTHEDQIREIEDLALKACNHAKAGELQLSGEALVAMGSVLRSALTQGAAQGWPKTPEEVRDFIGGNYSSLRYGNPHDGDVPSEDDLYEVTAHDLISAFRQWEPSPPPGATVPATQKDQHGETQPQPRPDDQDITQAAEIDASAVGGTVRPGADQHHEHREGNTATDGAHAGANSRGAGVRAANQAASQTRLRDLTDEEIDAIHDSLPLVEIINAAGRERSLVMDAINRAFARAVVVAAGAAVPMEAETVQQDSLDAKRLETFRKTLLAYADSMYCKGIERMRTDPCLGWEHKVKTCQYGETELAAHAQANRDFGAHFGIYEAIKQADAAIAAQEKKS